MLAPGGYPPDEPDDSHSDNDEAYDPDQSSDIDEEEDEEDEISANKGKATMRSKRRKSTMVSKAEKIKTTARRSKSMKKTLIPEKKTETIQRNSKNALQELLESSIFIGRWPKQPRTPRIPVESLSSATNYDPVVEIPRENVNGGTIARTSSESGLVNPNLQDSIFGASSSSSVNQNSASSSSSVEVQVQAQANISRSNYQHLYHPSNSVMELLDHFTRIANVKQQAYDLNQHQPWNLPGPIESATLSEISNSSSSGLQSQSTTLSDVSRLLPAMPSYQQPSYSLGPPQDYLTSSSSGAEFRPYDSRQQTTLSQRGFDLNELPTNDEDEDEDEGLNRNIPPRDEMNDERK